jgi:nucleoside-diphosphate-sugar epimerase
MRVFLAGATGVIGTPLVPLLVEAEHTVAGMTRSPEKLDQLAALGAEPVLCDVFDADELVEAVTSFHPDLVMHQLTDLPTSLDDLSAYMPRNDRMRSEGTRNLIAAAKAAAAPRFLAQSIAWRPEGRAEVVEEHERMVLAIGGVVVRYGRFYGPGTFHDDGTLPEPPRIHVEAAARGTLALLDAPSGVVPLVEPQEERERP